MLSVKQKSLNKNKVVIYVFIITLLVGALIFAYFSNIIDSFRGNNEQAVALNQEAGAAAVPQNQPGTATSTEVINIQDIDVNLFNKIANDPKFKTLKENYKDEGKQYKKGKANPFDP